MLLVEADYALGFLNIPEHCINWICPAIYYRSSTLGVGHP